MYICKPVFLRHSINVVSISARWKVVRFSQANSFCTSTQDVSQFANLQSQKEFLEETAKQLKINNLSDWYKADLTNTNLTKQSLYKLLSTAYPTHEWLPWKFNTTPDSYWDDPKNQKKFLEYAAQVFNVKELSDWYQVPKKDFLRIGGEQLLSKYNFSLSQCLTAIFPEFEWLPWKFIGVRNFWGDIENQRSFMIWAGKKLNMKEMSDWYNVSYKDFLDIKADTILRKYFNGSPYQLLSTVFPEYEWLPWKFAMCPRNYWENPTNQRKFMEWAAKELKIKDMSDWYKIKNQDIIDLGGQMLLRTKFQGSHILLLEKMYPEYEWLPWKFERSARNYWNDLNNQRKFMEWVGKKLQIKEMSDWLKVTYKELLSLGGARLLSKYRYSTLLSTVFPDYNWSEEAPTALLSSASKKTQYLLKSMLKTIFPKEEVLEEYPHPDIVSSSSGKPLTLDFFYPRLNIAFEYQGEQHFGATLFHHNQTSLEERKQFDNEKSILCKEKGISLISVPYWWNRDYDSLAATIYSQRPELFSEPIVASPIPLSPPALQPASKRANLTTKILMTATEWDEETMNPTGWWMTEKYDGMRVYWDGSNFYSRQGKKIKVPDSIKNQLPAFSLDFELWTQYGLYQDAVLLAINSGNDEEKWKKAVFYVFDAPDIGDKVFEERIEVLREMKQRGELPSFVKIVETVKCEGKQHLKEYFESIVNKGGEGIMLREPQSLYTAGRSESLRKYKPFFDTEVKVIENNYPHGFNCVQINGKHLFVGIQNNMEDAKKVKEGAVVTVKHSGVNVHGTLQFPKFYRERLDVKWDD